MAAHAPRAGPLGDLAEAFAAALADRPTPENPGPAVRAALFCGLLARSFLADRCLGLSAALSYTTVLSIVPLLAVAFAVTKGLGLYNAPSVRELLLRALAGRPEVVDRILEYIQNTNVKTLGAVGTALLVFTSISLLTTIESALNDIWKVRQARGPWSRFTNYAALIVICPLFLFASLSATATIQSSALVQKLLSYEVVTSLYLTALSVLPYLSIWAAFFLVYKFLPNTAVSAKSALIGALSGGTLWQLLQWVYLKYQFGMAGYNAIYGSFAQIPLLLVWLYLSWAVVLLGAEISHASGDFAASLDMGLYRHASQADRQTLALALILDLASMAAARQAPPPLPELARSLDLPPEAAADLCEALADKGLLLRLAGPTPAYAPAAPPDHVRAREILDALDHRRAGPHPPRFLARHPEAARLRDRVVARPETTLKDLLDLQAAAPRLPPDAPGPETPTKDAPDHDSP